MRFETGEARDGRRFHGPKQKSENVGSGEGASATLDWTWTTGDPGDGHDGLLRKKGGKTVGTRRGTASWTISPSLRAPRENEVPRKKAKNEFGDSCGSVLLIDLGITEPKEIDLGRDRVD